MAKDIISGFISDAENTATLMTKRLAEGITKKGNPFVIYTLTDGAADIIARQWDTSLQNVQQTGIITGGLAEFTIKTGTYNGEPSYTVISVNPAVDGSSLTDYMKAPPENPGMLYSELLSFADSVSDTALASVVRDCLVRVKDKLLIWPGGKHTHHDMQGGLLWHTVRVTRMADAVSGVYREVNRDVLIAGAILHDIGKIRELAPSPSGEYEQSVLGALLGHIYLGIEMFRESAEAKGYHGATFNSVMHVIAASHGSYRREAIAQPRSVEAFMLSQLDSIDAAGAPYLEASRNMVSGTLSVNATVDGMKIYKS